MRPQSSRYRCTVETNLQHVQESGLAGVVETEEEQFGVLVQQAEGGEDIVDCRDQQVSISGLGLWYYYSCCCRL